MILKFSDNKQIKSTSIESNKYYVAVKFDHNDVILKLMKITTSAIIQTIATQTLHQALNTTLKDIK